MKYRERLEKLEKRESEITGELSRPEVLKDQTAFQKLSKELAGLRPVTGAFRSYRQVETELQELERTHADSRADSEMKTLFEEEIKALRQKKDELIQSIEELLLKGLDTDSDRDVIVEIRAGTGGEEAALFAADLYRMYSKYALAHNLRQELISSSPTGIGGFKEIIFSVGGPSSYALFKYESGIHRVQRVPATEASGRIHTSAVTVAVLPEAGEAEVKIEPSDLKIDVFRASGAGGQHVNKTESAVRITHLPTGFVVTCQDERSQHKNKTKAMRVLRARLFEEIQRRQQNEMAKQRREQVGSGDRSGKVRTYNFPDQRVTDHRIGLTLHSLNDILNGRFDPLVQALEQHERERKLNDAA